MNFRKYTKSAALSSLNRVLPPTSKEDLISNSLLKAVYSDLLLQLKNSDLSCYTGSQVQPIIDSMDWACLTYQSSFYSDIGTMFCGNCQQ